MARWNLERAADAADMVRGSELEERLGLGEDEAARWRDIARRIYTGFDERTGLIEQFRGYHALEEIDLDRHAGRTVPMDVLLGPERIRGSKVIKQPDVVMLIHLLWDRFSPEIRELNYRYYEPRTAHGSSLSPAIHAAVAARLGDPERAVRYFKEAARIDLSPSSYAAGGVHVGALAGLWQAAVYGFAGLGLRPGGVDSDPHLPRAWKGLRFRHSWGGRLYRVGVDPAPGRAAWRRAA
jgi:kojibiose phosphorylase